MDRGVNLERQRWTKDIYGKLYQDVIAIYTGIFVFGKNLKYLMSEDKAKHDAAQYAKQSTKFFAIF